MSAALSLFGDPNTRPPLVIDRFTGDHAWLSNFGPGEATYDGDLYPTREHAFHAAKTLDPQARGDIAAAPTPGEAKQLGRTVDLRAGWDDKVRYEAMWEVLASAFNRPDLAGRLEATGTALLVEGNLHHDRHWGTCRCQEHQEVIGANHLGQTLMAIRSLRRDDPPNTWTRTALVGQAALFTAAQTGWIRDELRRVYGKLTGQHRTTAVLTGAAGLVDVEGAELAQLLGIPVWVYLPAPDVAAQLPRSVTYRHEQLRARAQRTAVLTSRPIVGRPGRAADLAQKVQTWVLRDSDALIAIRDRSVPTGRAAAAVEAAKTAGQPVITVDPIARAVTIAHH